MAIWWLATSKNEEHCSYNELKYRKILAQGWSCIGDLSALFPFKNNEEGFVEIINMMVEYKYDHDERRNPGRILKNLLSFKEGDLILCAEGESVKGLARVGANSEYRYDSGIANEYEYAQTMGPIEEWKDWDNNLVGEPPPTKAMGPIGIELYHGDEQAIKEVWGKL